MDGEIYKQTYGILDTSIARAMVILHEIAHATGALTHVKPNGEQDFKKIREFNDQILHDCLGQKPK